MELKPFPIPRAKRKGGFRSKAPAIDGVSSWTFTHTDLRLAAGHTDVEVESRGSMSEGTRYRPGDLARTLLGVRFN